MEKGGTPPPLSNIFRVESFVCGKLAYKIIYCSVKFIFPGNCMRELIFLVIEKLFSIFVRLHKMKYICLFKKCHLSYLCSKRDLENNLRFFKILGTEPSSSGWILERIILMCRRESSIFTHNHWKQLNSGALHSAGPGVAALQSRVSQLCTAGCRSSPELGVGTLKCGVSELCRAGWGVGALPGRVSRHYRAGCRGSVEPERRALLLRALQISSQVFKTFVQLYN